MATEISIDALGTELKDLLDRIPSGEKRRKGTFYFFA